MVYICLEELEMKEVIARQILLFFHLIYGMDGCFSVDQNGDILKSDIYCHDQVNTATEYGALIDNGYVIFNDTDVKEMKRLVL